MSGDVLAPGGSTDLGLSIPGDDRFRPTAQALCERIAQEAGCSAVDAREIGGAVDAAVAGLIAHAIAKHVAYEDRDIDLAFHADASRLEIEIACPRAGVPAGTLEPLLARVIDRLRGAVGPVEFGVRGSRCFCRLTRQLPDPVG